MYAYDTLTQAVEGMKARGFTQDFNIRNGKVCCDAVDRSFGHEELTVLETYRFEGPTDPADEAIAYGLESNTGVKGILVDGYGPSSEEDAEKLLQQIRAKARIR